MIIKFGDIEIGEAKSDDLILTELSPPQTSLERADINFPGLDGTQPGTTFERSMTWGFTVRTNAEDQDSARAALAQLVKLWRDPAHRQAGTYTRLSYRLDPLGTERFVYGQPGQLSFYDFGQSMRQGVATATFEFIQMDPLFYGAGGQESRVVTLQSGNRSLTIGGDTAALPNYIRFNTPRNGAKLVTKGFTITLTDKVQDSGFSVGAYLMIEPRSGRVTDSLGRLRPGLLAHSTPTMKEMKLSPGTQTVTVTGMTAAVIGYNDAYFSL